MRCYAIFFAATATLFAQLAAPSFDVASVKHNLHPRDVNGWSRSSADIPSPGRFVSQNESLGGLIRFAFDLKDYQIIGPAWLNEDSECFDIEAKAPFDTPKTQVRIMLQTLLGDRFKLAAHRETRPLPAYELTKGKGEPKLQPAAPGSQGYSANSQGGDVTFTNITISDVAYQFSRYLKYPVLDKTGITGAYDFKLTYDPTGSGNGPSLASAVQEQLGLRLESTKAPIEVLIIDHIEKLPTAN
jgi:uncharacterized protein (TIGR03435 family)